MLTGIDGDPRPMGQAPDLGADELEARLSIAKHAAADPVSPGGRITYTIRVTNTVMDMLPVQIVGGCTSAGTVLAPGGVVTWTSVVSVPGGVWWRLLRDYKPTMSEGGSDVCAEQNRPNTTCLFNHPRWMID